MVKKKRIVDEVETVTETVALEASTPVDNLRAILDEVKAYDGVIGYILRNSASAAIDLKDPAKIIDYAILSSTALDASEELSELFNLGEVSDVIIEGKNAKMLSLSVNENKISVFMEKDADHGKILRKLHSL